MPDEFKELLRDLRVEVHALRDTWRRLLIVAVVGVLIVMLTLAGVGAYFIIGTRHAADRSNQAIADTNRQADVQAQALRCIENYENARRDRDLLVSRVGTARNRALDARNLAEDAALNAAIAHEPQRKILRLAHIYSKKSRIYRRVDEHYYKVLAANPIPRLKKFRCAEQVARRAHQLPSTPNRPGSPGTPRPTVTVTVPATATRTVTVPGPTVTRVRTRPGPTVTRTVTVPPGKGRAVTTTATVMVTRTAPNPRCARSCPACPSAEGASVPDSVDYSFGRPDIPALVKAGIKLVARYLSHGSPKDLSAAEAAALHKAGIGVLLNWESVPGRPLGGAATGAADGRDAAAFAERIGAPHGLCIYYSCDTDASPSQFAIIADYYDAARKATDGRYRVGVYGEADLIDYLHKRGVVTSQWQTYAWSNGRVSANADLFQYLNNQTLGGAAVDFDRIINPDQLGAWWPAGSEFDMPSAEEIAKAVKQEPITKSGDSLAEVIRKILAAVTDQDGLADKIAAKVAAAVPAGSGGVTKAQVKAALREVFADAGDAS